MSAEERFSRRELFGSVKDKILGLRGFALQHATQKISGNLIRPPGAADEESFLSTCQRCGKCIEACPGVLREAGPEYGVALGTPYLVPREKPCSLCLACQGVCPSGAIRQLAREQVKLAVPVLDRKRCLAWHGDMCRACFDHCPDRGRAMSLEAFRRPLIQEVVCSGCGSCAHACVLEPGAISMKAL